MSMQGIKINTDQDQCQCILNREQLCEIFYFILFILFTSTVSPADIESVDARGALPLGLAIERLVFNPTSEKALLVFSAMPYTMNMFQKA